MDFILSTLQFIVVLFLVLLIFNLIIVVHEWGHFLAARWRGLKIEKFQIWFGKPLWKKTINGVQYGLGTIPAGGFVALPQMAPMEMLEGAAEDGAKLEPISAMDKIIVAFAGPLFSFGLAVVFAFIVWGVGKPVSRAGNSTTVGVVLKDGPADKAGIRSGDTIKRIDGQPVDTFSGMVDSVTWAIIASKGDEIIFEIERDGEEISIPVEAAKLEKDERPWYRKIFKRPSFRKVGIGPEVTPIIAGEPKPNSPAKVGGLKKGDVITHMDGEKLYSYSHMLQSINTKKLQEVDLTITRGTEETVITLMPRIPDKLGDYTAEELGLQPGFDPLPDEDRAEIDKQITIKHVDPYTQISETLKTMYNTLTAVFSPKSDVKASHLSGAVGIIDVYQRLLQSPDGWRLVLWFSVLLNINLAILNMLPIPILDGGHIVMAIIEGILNKPINLRVLELVNSACAIFLIGFMLYVSGFDTGDIIRRVSGDQEKEPWGFLPQDTG